MPLIKSAKPKAVSQNIREMVAAGHPQKQAVAAALRTADQAKKSEFVYPKGHHKQDGRRGHTR